MRDELNQRVRHIGVLIAAVAFCVVAQEKEKVPAKPQPKERGVDIPVSATEARPAVGQAESHRSELPKIDLPEFVITGIASIDLPEAEKASPVEDTGWLPLVFVDPVAVARDRNTIEIAVREKLSVHEVSAPSLNGRLMASIGTYSTSRVGLWLGQLNPDYSYLADVEYRSTKGYAPFTNRTGGHLTAQGEIPLRSSSSWLDGGKAGGFAKYGSHTYRFFGSSTPSLSRTASDLAFGATLTSSSASPIDYRAALGFSTLSLSDSSAKTTENQFSIRVDSWFTVASIPLQSRVQLVTASLSGSSTGTLPYVEANVGTQRLWWSNFFAQVSAHFYHAQGMLNQRLTRAYPRVSLGYVLSGKSTLSVSYRGEVRNGTLSSFVKACPYLSSASLVQHADVPLDITAALESDWNEVWRTRFSGRYRSIREYPLLTEGLQQGIWTMAYFGTTTVITYALDLFAKFNSNGYFGLSAAVNSTKNSVTQKKIPYVADFEITGTYRQTIAPGFSISPWVSFVDRRSADLISGLRIPAYVLTGLRTEYALLHSVNFFVDIRNAADRKYDVWRGYRAEPFMIFAGASYQW
ncbi:MAG: hypothetical protein AABZ02_05795 [Bacteroidota bacterium]